MSTWHERILVAEKHQDLLKPNVLEWMKFIETLNDPNIEEIVNQQIGSFFSWDDPDFFIEAIDDFFFDTLIMTEMISSRETFGKIMREICNHPHIKEKLLKNLEEYIEWCEEDLEKHRVMKAEFEKLKCKNQSLSSVST